MIAWLEYSADQKLKSDGELTKAVSWRDLQARTGLEYSRLSRGYRYKEVFPQLRFTPEIITSLYASSHLEIPLSVRNTYLGDTMDLLPDVTSATREATADDKSHLSLPFLERLLEMNVCLGLRYPHSSHKTQVASVCAARSAASLFSYNHI
jgi:hypothetical protein